MRSPRKLFPSHLLGFASLIVLLFSSLAYGQTPPWGQALSFGGSGTDGGNAVKVDRRSNKYVAGSFSGTAKFGTHTLKSAGGLDAFLIKFRSDGSMGWIDTVGGAGDDQAFNIGFDGDENVYVSGSFTGTTVVFGSTDGVSKTVNGAGASIYLAKYNPDGKLLWVQYGISGEGNNEGFGVAVNPASGVVYMAGRTQSSTTFSSSNGNFYTVGGVEPWHVYLVKYDAAGNFQWGEQNSAAGNSFAESVAIDSENNAYVVGWFENQATFNGRDGKSITVQGISQGAGAPPYPDDAFVAKYNSHGDVQWVNDIGGYKAIAHDVAVAPNGNIGVTGFIGNINDGSASQAQTIAFSQSPGTSINLGGGVPTEPYNPDVFAAIYAPSGVLLSAVRYGDSQNDSGGGIAFDAQGNMYLSGMFGGTVDFGGATLKGSKESNLYVVKYTGSTVDWGKMAPGLGIQGNFEGEPRVAVNSATGKVFVSGTYVGSGQVGATTLNSLGDEDIFFANIPVPMD
jgi:hypothetical protein